MNKTAILLLGAIATFLVDQYTKWQIVTNFRMGEAVALIRGHFELTHVRNEGAAFGFMQGFGPSFFLAISALAMGFIVYIFFRMGRDRILTALSLSLVLGGALGNFVDRAVRGSVVDFIRMTLGGPGDWYFVRWPTYNVADIAICIGVIILIQQLLAQDRIERAQQSAVLA